MTNQGEGSLRYPLLESLLQQRGLSLQGIYTTPDAARVFGASCRTIQEWIRDDKLPARDLPGRGRFLSEDLEVFLQGSLKKQPNPADPDDSVDEKAQGAIRILGRVRKHRKGD